MFLSDGQGQLLSKCLRAICIAFLWTFYLTSPSFFTALLLLFFLIYRSSLHMKEINSL